MGWQHPTLLERAAQRTVSAFLAHQAKALGVCITLQPGDTVTETQRFRHDLGDGTDGPTRELVISYLSPRFFTLLILAEDARTALRHGGSRGVPDDVHEFVVSDEVLFYEVFDTGDTECTWPTRLLRLLPGRGSGDEQDPQPSTESEQYPGPHPLLPESRFGQLGFAVLLCALVATEWAEELLWRVARVRWAVADPGKSR